MVLTLEYLKFISCHFPGESSSEKMKRMAVGGATFKPAQVNPGSLLWLSICLHVMPARVHPKIHSGVM